MERVRRAVDRIRREGAPAPEWAVVLGTGLGALGDEIDVEATVPYGAIPDFPPATVEEHEGRLLLGSIGGRSVAAMSGRYHRYEGHTLGEVTFPIRVLRELGATTLVTSGAAGGMEPLWERGDLVLISDHINLMGDNPLVGPNVEEQGPRFPDMSEAYHAGLRRRAREAAVQMGVQVREGVYAGVTGPNLETPAEYRMLRTLGADLVGMSTVPEVIVARHAGMRVLGTAVVTDMCLPDDLEPVEVEDVIRVAGEAAPTLSALVRRVMESEGDE
ncbi:MAG: purine-nucleoside phosphorylase [Candidatus Palauibacterales bacterium]|nr:purine-nucleoside phosphorylase [Candidatus Palauibacterales bacterium]